MPCGLSGHPLPSLSFSHAQKNLTPLCLFDKFLFLSARILKEEEEGAPTEGPGFEADDWKWELEFLSGRQASIFFKGKHIGTFCITSRVIYRKPYI